MEFNLDKCEVLHFGKLNQGRTYRISGRAQVGNFEKRVLGVELNKFPESGDTDIGW